MSAGCAEWVQPDASEPRLVFSEARRGFGPLRVQPVKLLRIRTGQDGAERFLSLQP